MEVILLLVCVWCSSVLIPLNFFKKYANKIVVVYHCLFNIFFHLMQNLSFGSLQLNYANPVTNNQFLDVLRYKSSLEAVFLSNDLHSFPLTFFGSQRHLSSLE